MPAETVAETWITAAAAGEILGIPWRTVPRLADAGRVAVRQVPGHPPRYSLADVERVAAHSTYRTPEPAETLS